MMTARERLECAWAFKEPDRVPIELELPDVYRRHPAAGRLVELVDQYADSFRCVQWAVGGFLGLPATRHEEIIEDRPGEYVRKRLVCETEVGEFTAVTFKPACNTDPGDCHWEKRFIATREDMERVAAAPRAPMPWDPPAYLERVREVGERGIPVTGLFHPLGNLVRNSDMEEAYSWFREAPELVHCYLERANAQVVATVEQMQRQHGGGMTFMSWAHEMLIPPWMGFELFDEFVQPYDARVYAAIHRGGGRMRAHCHGRCMAFLERFAAMGIDAVEPLEHAPMGDVNLAEAKRLVGHRMMLSGNVASERFATMTAADVRAEVRAAIAAAARGGGFSLSTSGAGPDAGFTGATLEHVIAMCEEFMRAGLELGRYPIRD